MYIFFYVTTIINDKIHTFKLCLSPFRCSNSRDNEDFRVKVEGHQRLGGALILENYPATSSDVEEGQRQTEEPLEQGEERQLTEDQLREAQYRQALVEQQEERQLTEEPHEQGEERQLTEEQLREAQYRLVQQQEDERLLEEPLEQGEERQLTEEQLREAQYRLVQQQEERLMEEPLSDEVMPQGEDDHSIEEQEKSADSNNEELSDVVMFSSANVEDDVAMTMTHDDVSMVNKTSDTVTSQCEERAASVV